MQTLTQVLSSGTFEIKRIMNVLQFNIFGLGSDADFSYLGNALIGDGDGGNIPSLAVPLTGQVAYNSRTAPQNSPWENIFITVNAGSVCIELSTE